MSLLLVGLALADLRVLVHDVDKVFTNAPGVDLRCADGTYAQVWLRDDGNAPDGQRDDGVWSGSAAVTGAGPVDVAVRWSGGSAAAAVPTWDDGQGPVAWVALDDGSVTAVPEGTELPASDDDEGATAEEGGTGAEGGRGRTPGGLAGGVIGLTTTALLILAVAWLRPRPPLRAAASTWTRVPPRRMTARDLPTVLAGPLAGHRVIVVAARAPPGTIACDEDGVLPEEVVAWVEHLAAAPGGPVALVVLEPGRLERSWRRESYRDLAGRIAGRFPLYGVDGPVEWAAATSE